MNIKIFATTIAVAALSGCSFNGDGSDGTDTKTSPIGNAVPKAVESTRQAQENVNDAANKENARLSQTLNQNEKNAPMEYVNRYDGAVIHTSLGDITVKFYNDASPLTVENFLKLAGTKFYDGTRFHRVIKDFMIQGGDPNSKDADWSNDGTGGPGYTFADEFNSHSLVRGSLAMANAGPNTNGSQFFIVTAPSTPWLDGKHTNFGEVVSGMDIIDAIENAKVNGNDHPLEDITIKGIDLIEKK